MKTYRVCIDRIVAGGDGLGTLRASSSLDGKTLFVPAAAVGDELEVRLIETKNDYARGIIETIVQPGRGRVEPACSLYGQCGGCNFMHISYEAQLEAKRNIVLDSFQRAGCTEIPSVRCIPSEPLGYRSRAKFHAGADACPSYTRRSSNELLPAAACPVVVPALSDWLASKPKLVGKEPITVFAAAGAVYVENINAEAEISILGTALRFHVGCFFQSNIALVEKLIPAVTEALFPGGDTGLSAADVYCGVGLFGTFMKERAKELVCVEEDKRSISYAVRNVGRGASFAAQSAEQWLEGNKRHFDSIVVDPPRAGLSFRARKKLAGLRPRHIAYVSCNPVSLARDSAFLIETGYVLRELSLFDFYPQTSHIESYAYFELDR